MAHSGPKAFGNFSDETAFANARGSSYQDVDRYWVQAKLRAKTVRLRLSGDGSCGNWRRRPCLNAWEGQSHICKWISDVVVL